jgi:hypothetical protein
LAWSRQDQPIAVLSALSLEGPAAEHYTENHNIIRFDLGCELCYAGKKHMVPRLAGDCSQLLWKHLVPVAKSLDVIRKIDEK